MDVEYYQRMSELRDHFDAREMLARLLIEGVKITEVLRGDAAVQAWKKKVDLALEGEAIDRGG